MNVARIHVVLLNVVVLSVLFFIVMPTIIMLKRRYGNSHGATSKHDS
jgi:hypothetical protein